MGFPKSFSQLREHLDKTDKQLPEQILAWEVEETEKSRINIIEKMENYWKVMKEGVNEGLRPDIKSVSGLTGGDAYKLLKDSQSLIGKPPKKAMAYAMAMAEVNASMGKIVATPTAGSCGIMPGVLMAVEEEFDINQEEVVNAIFVASMIGKIIAYKGTVAGAEGGCQAECGSASAMSAGAVTYLLGGSLKQIENAVAISIKNVMGLVCDPVAGLVEVPCIKRNGHYAAAAMISAQMALADVHSVIDVDEVIDAMAEVGKMLPEELRETSMGGLANTSSARRIEKVLRGE
ncbi:L-serine ammonia-lyase, iron-sulfur-dependent, subunit alpha [Proteinivorax hydrogeniformans]|uniref:L-serine dehydratase n=1 Tax=Proteinivorax hydrogeniformans TaxID=1826727 RepID=A0AAU8HPB9_9FIRM